MNAAMAQSQAYEYNAQMSRYQAAAAAQAYEYNAAIQRRNILIAQENAKLELEAGQIDARTQARENMGQISQMQSQMIRSGFSMEGTALLVLDEDVRKGAEEVSKIKTASELKARNYMVDVLNLEAEARMNEYNAQVARVQGENQASSEIQRAEIAKYQGQVAQNTYNKNSTSTMLTGLTSSFGQFGGAFKSLGSWLGSK
jgi:hypothetical protein